MDIQSFWTDVVSQNRARLSSYFCKDAVIRWHCTNEEFTVSEYVRVNCDYPGTFKGQIERIEELPHLLILVGRVFSTDNSQAAHVVSFIRLKNGLIGQLDEYWGDDGKVPLWRKQLTIGKAISSENE